MKTCPACSAALPHDAQFCTKCGTSLNIGLSGVPTEELPVEDATIRHPAETPTAPESVWAPPANPSPPTAQTTSTACSSCGSALRLDQQFCTKCGTTRDTNPSQLFEDDDADTPPPKWLIGLGLTLLFVVVGLAAAWFLPTANDAATEAADLANPAVQTTAVTLANQTSPTTVAEPMESTSCETAIASYASAAASWAQSLLVDQRTGLMVSASPDPVLSQADSVSGCDTAETLADTAGLAAPPGTDMLVRLTVINALASDQSPDAVLAAASATVPTAYLYQPISVELATPAWIVIYESMEQSTYTETEALGRFAEYERTVGRGGVLASGDYDSLNAGYWVVYSGPYTNGQTANDICADQRSNVDFCYHRFIQMYGDQAAIAEGCGEYGLRETLHQTDIRLGPSPNQDIVATYAAGSQLHALGYVEQVEGTSWIPVDVDGKLGWVSANQVSIAPACVGVPTIPVDDTCQAVSDALGAHLVSAASIGYADNDEIGFVVSRAERLNCDADMIHGSVALLLDAALTATADTATQLRLAVYRQYRILQT